jgi:hypothetical protein
MDYGSPIPQPDPPGSHFGESAAALSAKTTARAKDFQTRGARACVGQTGVLAMHMTGTGKTRLMLLGAEQFKGSRRYTKAHFVAKEAVRGSIRDEMGKIGVDADDPYYVFHTQGGVVTLVMNLAAQACREAGLPEPGVPELELVVGALGPRGLGPRGPGAAGPDPAMVAAVAATVGEKFGRSMVVVDEFHTAYPAKAGNPKKRAALRTLDALTLIRRAAPRALIMLVTATPLLYHPLDIAYVYQVLNPHYDGAGPAREETAPIGAGDNAKAAAIIQALAENYRVLYASPPASVRQGWVGDYAWDGEAPPIADWEEAHLDQEAAGPRCPWEAGDRERWAVLAMGPTQTGAYLAELSGRDIYKTARRNTIAAPAGAIDAHAGVRDPTHPENPWGRLCQAIYGTPALAPSDPRLADYVKGEYSAQLGFWLGVEVRAWAEGHWGVGAWYFDSVQGGARRFYDLLLANGWVPYSEDGGDGSDGRPRVLLLTSEEGSGGAKGTKSLAALGVRNERGQRIRTVIYTRVMGVGITIPNVLRAGSQRTFARGNQIQSDNRRVRYGSLRGVTGLLRARQAGGDVEGFVAANAPYHAPGAGPPRTLELRTLNFNVISVPGVPPGSVEGEVPAGLEARAVTRGSMDIRMLQFQDEKSEAIDPLVASLRGLSVDAVAEGGGGVDHGWGSYGAYYEAGETWEAAAQAVRAGAVAPAAPEHPSAPWVELRAALEALELPRFRGPGSRGTETPADVAGGVVLGMGVGGLVPAPGFAGTTAELPPRTPLGDILAPRDDAAAAMVSAALGRALDRLGRGLAEKKEPSDLDTVLLGAYARTWAWAPVDGGHLIGRIAWNTATEDFDSGISMRLYANWDSGVESTYYPARGAPERWPRVKWYHAKRAGTRTPFHWLEALNPDDPRILFVSRLGYPSLLAPGQRGKEYEMINPQGTKAGSKRKELKEYVAGRAHQFTRPPVKGEGRGGVDGVPIFTCVILPVGAGKLFIDSAERVVSPAPILEEDGAVPYSDPNYLEWARSLLNEKLAAPWVPAP